MLCLIVVLVMWVGVFGLIDCVHINVVLIRRAAVFGLI